MSDAPGTTPNLGLLKPNILGSEDVWGDELNQNADTLDAAVHTLQTNQASTAAVAAAAVQRAGDAMTGTLTLAADPTQPLQAVTKQYVDARPPFVEAPVDGLAWGRLNAAWTHVPTLTLNTNVGGNFDMNSVPVGTLGLLSITNQGASAPNWPADNTDKTAFVIAGYNSNPGWANQIMMGARIYNGVVPLWYRFFTDGGYSPWYKVITDYGGTLTGALTLAGDPTLPMQAATKHYVDTEVSSVAGIVEAPVNNATFGRINASWATVLATVGGTLTGTVNLASPALPAGATPCLNATDLVLPTGGHLAFNAWLNSGGTGWSYKANGGAAILYFDTPTNRLTCLAAPPGTAGQPVSLTQAWSVDQLGNLVGANSIIASKAAGNAFVGSWQTGGTSSSNVGFWNSGNTLFFGNADGNGTVQAARGSLDGGGSLSLNGSLTAANGFVLGASGVFAATDQTFGLYQQGSTRIFAFGSGWFWTWDSASGQLSWVSSVGNLWAMRASDGMAFNSTGAVGGIGAFVNLSDQRGKAAVAPSAHGLDVALRLNPVTFERQATPSRAAAETELGFIAQEVRAVLPEAVVAMGVTLPDGSGGLDDAEPTLGLRETALIPVLVNSIKEMHGQILDLTRRVRQLEMVAHA